MKSIAICKVCGVPNKAHTTYLLMKHQEMYETNKKYTKERNKKIKEFNQRIKSIYE